MSDRRVDQPIASGRSGWIRTVLVWSIVFLSGFALMVLEIVGARYLAKDFGGSFYVWTSQIGVVLIALALGYTIGGILADRWGRARPLSWLLVPAGLIMVFIPEYTPPVVEAIILRHPPDEPIPALWQKLDPVLGSALIFLVPCLVLAVVPPYMIRLSARHLSHVGRTSGLVYAASTVGGIAGVFGSAYVLIDQMTVTTIFRATGVTTMLVGGLCLWMEPSGREKVNHSDAS